MKVVPWTVERRYPDARARREADRVIECMDDTIAMNIYCDMWIRAYINAGGKVVV